MTREELQCIVGPRPVFASDDRIEGHAWKDVNVIIGDAVDEADIRALFGPFADNDIFVLGGELESWAHLLWRLGSFDSHGQARKSSWGVRGIITEGFHDAGVHAILGPHFKPPAQGRERHRRYRLYVKKWTGGKQPEPVTG